MPPRKHPRNSHLLQHIHLRDEIEVWWPHDQTYYPGRITEALAGERHRVVYSDGEVEDLRLETEQWRFRGAAAARVQSIIGSRPHRGEASSPDLNSQPDGSLSPSRPSASTSAPRRQSKKKKSQSKHSSSPPPVAAASSTSSSRRLSRSTSQLSRVHSSVSDRQKRKSAASAQNLPSNSDSPVIAEDEHPKASTSSTLKSPTKQAPPVKRASDMRATSTVKLAPPLKVAARAIPTADTLPTAGPRHSALVNAISKVASSQLPVASASAPDSPKAPEKQSAAKDPIHVNPTDSSSMNPDPPFKRKIILASKPVPSKPNADAHPASIDSSKRTVSRRVDPSSACATGKSARLSTDGISVPLKPKAPRETRSAEAPKLTDKAVRVSGAEDVPGPKIAQEKSRIRTAKVEAAAAAAVAAAGSQHPVPPPPPLPDKRLVAVEGFGIRMPVSDKPKSPAVRESAESIQKRTDVAHQKALAAATATASQSVIESSQKTVPVTGAPLPGTRVPKRPSPFEPTRRRASVVHHSVQPTPIGDASTFGRSPFVPPVASDAMTQKSPRVVSVATLAEQDGVAHGTQAGSVHPNRSFTVRARQDAGDAKIVEVSSVGVVLPAEPIAVIPGAAVATSSPGRGTVAPMAISSLLSETPNPRQIYENAASVPVARGERSVANSQNAKTPPTTPLPGSDIDRSAACGQAAPAVPGEDANGRPLPKASPSSRRPPQIDGARRSTGSFQNSATLPLSSQPEPSSTQSVPHRVSAVKGKVMPAVHTLSGGGIKDPTSSGALLNPIVDSATLEPRGVPARSFSGSSSVSAGNHTQSGSQARNIVQTGSLSQTASGQAQLKISTSAGLNSMSKTIVKKKRAYNRKERKVDPARPSKGSQVAMRNAPGAHLGTSAIVPSVNPLAESASASASGAVGAPVGVPIECPIASSTIPQEHCQPPAARKVGSAIQEAVPVDGDQVGGTAMNPANALGLVDGTSKLISTSTARLMKPSGRKRSSVPLKIAPAVLVPGKETGSSEMHVVRGSDVSEMPAADASHHATVVDSGIARDSQSDQIMGKAGVATAMRGSMDLEQSNSMVDAVDSGQPSKPMVIHTKPKLLAGEDVNVVDNGAATNSNILSADDMPLVPGPLARLPKAGGIVTGVMLPKNAAGSKGLHTAKSGSVPRAGNVPKGGTLPNIASGRAAASTKAVGTARLKQISIPKFLSSGRASTSKSPSGSKAGTSSKDVSVAKNSATVKPSNPNSHGVSARTNAAVSDDVRPISSGDGRQDGVSRGVATENVGAGVGGTQVVSKGARGSLGILNATANMVPGDGFRVTGDKTAVVFAKRDHVALKGGDVPTAVRPQKRRVSDSVGVVKRRRVDDVGGSVPKGGASSVGLATLENANTATPNASAVTRDRRGELTESGRGAVAKRPRAQGGNENTVGGRIAGEAGSTVARGQGLRRSENSGFGTDGGGATGTSPGVGSSALAPSATGGTVGRGGYGRGNGEDANNGGRARSGIVRGRGSSLVTQNVERGTASLPLDILMRTITESNKVVLQSKVGPLTTRMEHLFAITDDRISRVLKKIEGLDSVHVGTVDDLRSGVAGVNEKLVVIAQEQNGLRTMVSRIPTREQQETWRDEVKSEIAVQMEELKVRVGQLESKFGLMKDSLENIKTGQSEAIRTSLNHTVNARLENLAEGVDKKVLENVKECMGTAIADLQKDSVMVLSRAIDAAMRSVFGPGSGGGGVCGLENDRDSISPSTASPGQEDVPSRSGDLEGSVNTNKEIERGAGMITEKEVMKDVDQNDENGSSKDGGGPGPINNENSAVMDYTPARRDSGITSAFDMSRAGAVGNSNHGDRNTVDKSAANGSGAFYSKNASATNDQDAVVGGAVRERGGAACGASTAHIADAQAVAVIADFDGRANDAACNTASNEEASKSGGSGGIEKRNEGVSPCRNEKNGNEAGRGKKDAAEKSINDLEMGEGEASRRRGEKTASVVSNANGNDIRVVGDGKDNRSEGEISEGTCDGFTNDAASGRVTRVGQGNAVVEERNSADIEKLRSVARQGRELIAKAIVEWMLAGGCRSHAPKDERVNRVSSEWVKESSERCLREVRDKLKGVSSEEELFKKFNHLLGEIEVELDWLMSGPTTVNIRKARFNYKGWDPRLLDFEWESERRVLTWIAICIIHAEKLLVGSGRIVVDDIMESTRRFIEYGILKVSQGSGGGGGGVGGSSGSGNLREVA